MTRRGWFLTSGAILVILLVIFIRVETGPWFALPDSQDPNVDCSFMRSLLWVDPKERAEADAAAAIARRERHLLVIYGLALMVPREAEQETLGTFTLTTPDSRETAPIDCTSDSLESQLHQYLNRKAQDYAARYNAVILAKTGAN